MKTKARLKNLRIAPRKVRLVADLIKGLNVDEALVQLRIKVKGSSPVMEKLLKSAISNAENNFGLDKNNLYVFNVLVQAGPMLKRWRPRAFGRAAQILKRTSHIELILEERVEGKGRKTKDEMEKEKQKRLEEKKKNEKQVQKEKEEESKKQESEGEVIAKTTEKVKESSKIKKGGETKGLASRIFRRKSM